MKKRTMGLLTGLRKRRGAPLSGLTLTLVLAMLVRSPAGLRSPSHAALGLGPVLAALNT